jgi:hypothetical protein
LGLLVTFALSIVERQHPTRRGERRRNARSQEYAEQRRRHSS